MRMINSKEKKSHKMTVVMMTPFEILNIFFKQHYLQSIYNTLLITSYHLFNSFVKLFYYFIFLLFQLKKKCKSKIYK